ncbi:MAG: hypothetical protein NXI20_19330 [bacterium]|nr:hypothetical protein [bacterium]
MDNLSLNTHQRIKQAKLSQTRNGGNFGRARTMKGFWTILLLLTLQFPTFATRQMHDILIYKGQRYRLHTDLLKSYFEKYPKRHPESEIISSGLWNGYHAIFEVNDNVITVKEIRILARKKIRIRGAVKWRTVTKEVFPNKEDRRITNITGILKLFHGDIIKYAFDDNAIYTKYLLLEVENDMIKKYRKYVRSELHEFTKRQFTLFQETPEYQKLLEKYRQDGFDEDYAIDNIEFNILRYTTKFLD